MSTVVEDTYPQTELKLSLMSRNNQTNKEKNYSNHSNAIDSRILPEPMKEPKFRCETTAPIAIFTGKLLVLCSSFHIFRSEKILSNLSRSTVDMLSGNRCCSTKFSAQASE
ncbi:HTH-type transcriptional regulator CbbR [Striga asiatica]|uniref:HTH-type transcriptional regulator CbbR n=1 Tax=Striga asiatica TaxID=4170 RepID=A0A5A7QJL2_STRAF|nr:HTH-type transcriptional regulator CbbR [Striga asiatica]